MQSRANKATLRCAVAAPARRGGSIRRLRLTLWFVGALVASWVPAAPATAPALLVVGDSLSSAYGFEVQAGWVALLQARLDRQGKRYRVVNASISGDTTAGGLARLPELLATHRPSVVLVELGGNDGLQGLDLGAVRDNLETMVQRIQASGARMLLLGMRIPPNYGLPYSERFHAIYAELAAQFEVPLVPFLLDGIAEDRQLMQTDGIHPKAVAQGKILDNVWPYLERLL